MRRQMTEREPNTVAVIDDDEAVRDSLAFMLGVVDHRVETFGSAVEFLKEATGRFVCVIVDQHMPDMTGLELVQQLRSAVRKLPVMLLSGALTEADRTRAIALKVDEVLEKPVDEHKVLAFVTSAVA
jgi:two-component system response regulator FixJ